MNFLDSECSSGCESGWTLYLEQSFLSANASHKRSGLRGKSSAGRFCNDIGFKEKGVEEKEDQEQEEEEEEEEEEDLSMVSDASSGPPHFHDDNHIPHPNDDFTPCLFPDMSKDDIKFSKSGTGIKRQKMKLERQGLASSGGREQTSFLDDTASSRPPLNLSNNKIQDVAPTNINQGSMEIVLDFSQGFSATPFQDRPAFQDPFGSFLQPSQSGNQLQKLSGMKGIRRWK